MRTVPGPKSARLRWLPLAMAAAGLAACGGGSSPNSGSNSSTSSTATAAFPSGLSLASPTEIDSETTQQASASPLLEGLMRALAHVRILPEAHAATTPASAFAARAQRIDALLNGSVPVLGTLIKPARLVQTETDAPCYGPAVKYLGATHPNGGGTAADGQLPPGDLGLWEATDTTSGHACAAAQLNARMQGAAQRSTQGLRMLAVLARQAAASSGGLPAAGAAALDLTASMPAITGLSFGKATIQQTVAGTYAYDIQATFTDPATSVTHRIDMRLTHTTTTPSEVFNGLFQYAITGKFTGGNCPGGPGQHDVTWVGTLKYGKTSSTQLDLSHRSGMYCGAGTVAGSLATDRGATYATDGQLDPSSKLALGTGKGWGNNFSRFAATLNPSTEAGSYVYVWQAGPGDSHGRTLQVTLQQQLAGKVAVAHFGFGADIAAATDGGLIQGMFCNWAGPGHGPKGLANLAPYAQRQQMTLGASAWTASSSNILYAPTNSCVDTTSASAWLDRNLDNTIDGSDTPLNITGTETNFLIGKGTSPDIKSAIGFTVPSMY
jgi:hypothetical protein